MRLIDWIPNTYKKVRGSFPLLWKNRLVYKQTQLIIKLRKKHKELTRKTSGQLLDDQAVSKQDQLRLQLTDDLIVHNAAIMFNRSIWYILPAFGIPLILVSTLRSYEAPVSIQVRATSVMWKVANAEPGIPVVFDWNMYTSGSEMYVVDSVLIDPEDNPDPSDTLVKNLALLPCSSNIPVKVHQIPIPDKCYMTIGYTDSLQAHIEYQWRDSLAAAPVIKWNLTYQGRGVSYGGKMLTDTCTSTSRITSVQKQLRRGALFSMPLEGLGKWNLQHPIRVSEISFSIDDKALSDTRSSVVSGKIRLLNTSDTIELDRGDRLRIAFKEPVDLYLSTEPGYVNIRTSGTVTSLYCGSPALGDDINKMPRELKTITDESPYLLTLIGIILPLLMAMVIRQKKSI